MQGEIEAIQIRKGNISLIFLWSSSLPPLPTHTFMCVAMLLFLLLLT